MQLGDEPGDEPGAGVAARGDPTEPLTLGTPGCCEEHGPIGGSVSPPSSPPSERQLLPHRPAWEAWELTPHPRACSLLPSPESRNGRDRSCPLLDGSCQLLDRSCPLPIALLSNVLSASWILSGLWILSGSIAEPRPESSPSPDRRSDPALLLSPCRLPRDRGLGRNFEGQAVPRSDSRWKEVRAFSCISCQIRKASPDDARSRDRARSATGHRPHPARLAPSAPRTQHATAPHHQHAAPEQSSMPPHPLRPP